MVLSGEDAQTLDMLKLGATGTISVTANVMPTEMAQFCEAWLDGDAEAAEALDARLQPVHAALFMESGPTPTKWALFEMKRIQRGIRLPLLELSANRRDELVDVLKTAGAL